MDSDYPVVVGTSRGKGWYQQQQGNRYTSFHSESIPKDHWTFVIMSTPAGIQDSAISVRDSSRRSIPYDRPVASGRRSDRSKNHRNRNSHPANGRNKRNHRAWYF